MTFSTSHNKSHAPAGSNPPQQTARCFREHFHWLILMEPTHQADHTPVIRPGRSWDSVLISLLGYSGSPAFHCSSVLLRVWGEESFIMQLNKYMYIWGLSLGDRIQWNLWEALNTLELLPKPNSYCGEASNISMASDICNCNNYFIFQEWVDETSKKSNKNSQKIPLVHNYLIQRLLVLFNKKFLFYSSAMT